MLKIKLLLGLFMLIACASVEAAPGPVNWNWKNQYGSTLNITTYDPSTGAMTGIYVNNASGSCGVGQRMPVTGWYNIGPNGYAFNFSVNWGACASITTWMAQLQPSANFQSLWLLSLAAPIAWNGTVTGTDAFVFQGGDADKEKFLKAK